MNNPLGGGLVVPKERLRDYIGQPRTAAGWLTIDQDRIDGFAEVTEDFQYIHVDPERAAKSPFGGTIAHGFLTLSLLPKLLESIQLVPENIVMGINYGLNRVRFPSPVPVGSQVRAVATLKEVSEPAPDRITLTTEIIIEIRGAEKPAVVAESLAMCVLGTG